MQQKQLLPIMLFGLAVVSPSILADTNHSRIAARGGANIIAASSLSSWSSTKASSSVTTPRQQANNGRSQNSAESGQAASTNKNASTALNTPENPVIGDSRPAAQQQLVTTAASDTNSEANDGGDSNTDMAGDNSDSTSTPDTLNNAVGLGPNSRFQLNGFLSVGGSEISGVSNNVKYDIPEHGAVGTNFSFAPNSLAGLQLSAKLTKTLSVVTQFVAAGDDTNGNKAYRVSAEWAFLRYNLRPNMQFQVGRFRLPLFMYSDTQQVGYSYPWLYLPNEVYRLVPFQNMNGVIYIYTIPVGKSGWTAKLQPFYGANSSQFDIWTLKTPAGPQLLAVPLVATFDEDNIIGLSASVGNTVLSFRASYVHLNLRGTLLVGTPPENVLSALNGQSASFWSAGAKLNWKSFVLTGEFAQRNLPSLLASLRGYYAMLGFRFKQFLPTITYGNISTTNTPGLEVPQNQSSWTLGLNYYISANLASKISVSRVSVGAGGYGLFNLPPGKQAVYVYGIGLDAIF